MTPDNGGPAFPTIHRLDEEASLSLQHFKVASIGGMNLWDYFAASALQGYGQNMLVMSNAIEGWKETGRGGTRETCIAEYLVGLAGEIADAMLAERKKRFGQ